ncbi:MAG TPA: hypothetical protein VNB24_05550 [Acidimicrobiales bacterium]|nr:hypothetical protein [Acidimicrobiales bacterium]
MTRAQALASGVSEDQLYRRIRSGTWESPQPRVYAPAGMAYSPERILLAACLSVNHGAMAFGRSAAWLWSADRWHATPASLEIVVSRDQDPRLRGVIVHRFADVNLTEPSFRRGVPVTNPLRTAVDLGAVASPATVLAFIEDGRRAKLFRIPAVIAELERIARRGRDGAGVLRSVLDELNVLGSWPPSRLEAKALALFRSLGLPDPLREMVWGADGEYRLDFYWPRFGLVVEVDGWSFHSSDEARGRDLKRQNALVLAGLPPLRYTWRDIVRDQRRVRAELGAFQRQPDGLLRA